MPGFPYSLQRAQRPPVTKRRGRDSGASVIETERGSGIKAETETGMVKVTSETDAIGLGLPCRLGHGGHPRPGEAVLRVERAEKGNRVDTEMLNDRDTEMLNDRDTDTVTEKETGTVDRIVKERDSTGRTETRSGTATKETILERIDSRELGLVETRSQARTGIETETGIETIAQARETAFATERTIISVTLDRAGPSPRLTRPAAV